MDDPSKLKAKIEALPIVKGAVYDGEAKCSIVECVRLDEVLTLIDTHAADLAPTGNTALVEGECPACGALPCDQANNPLKAMPTAEKALQAIADLPAPRTEDGMMAHEQAYRAVEALFSIPPKIVCAALASREAAAPQPTPEVDELVARLRRFAIREGYSGVVAANQAADLITSQQAEIRAFQVRIEALLNGNRSMLADDIRADLAPTDNTALVEALQPFAEAAEIKLCGEWRDDESIQRTDVAFHIKFGHLRAARTALASREAAAKKEEE